MRKKAQITALLKSIETGDPEPIAVVNEEKYIQHNPQTHEGSEGLAALFNRLSQTQPRISVVRAFEDGDYVFAHTEYDFAKRNIGFEVFRFEDDQAVEHWDNIQERAGPNASGRSMVDGPTESSDTDYTESNRALAHSFVERVLIGGAVSELSDYLHAQMVEHNPHLRDGVDSVRQALIAERNGVKQIEYQKLHRVLAEGSFVLSVSEGHRNAVHTAFYDLYRIENRKIVEHWDTTEKVVPRNEWKNDNGKF